MRPSLLLSLLLLASVVPTAAVALNSSCSAANPAYQPTQTAHIFVYSPAPLVDVFDTSGCATGDGDNDLGRGGAQFPELSQGACDPGAPVVGHHNGGTGALATVRSNAFSLPVIYTFGTDGEDPAAWMAGAACTGNAVISDSYDTDPFDCGQGVTGLFPLGPSATLGPNLNYHSGSPADPDPWELSFGAVPQGSARADPNGLDCFGVMDGSAWVFLSDPTRGLSFPLFGAITAP